MKSLVSVLEENNFLSGGLVLGVLGMLVAMARQLPGRAWSASLRRWTVVVEVRSDSEVFGWVEAWLATHPDVRRGGQLRADVARRVAAPGESPPSDAPGRRERPKIRLTAGDGTHWIRHRGVLVAVTRDRPSSDSPLERLATREVITLRALTFDRGFVRRLLEDARDSALPADDPRALVFEPDYSSWTPVGRARVRTPDTLVLREGLLEALLAEVGAFLDGREWYEARQVPYRLGLLFSGSPGTGKTTAVSALAARFGLDLALLSLSGFTRAEIDRLVDLLRCVPERAILVLEDVDRHFDLPDEEQVPLDVLLNALDGIGAGEGRILVMTANRPESLPKALVRRGRIDREIRFGPADFDVARRLFLRFFPGESSRATRFAENWSGRTPAEIQGHLLHHRDNPAAAAGEEVASERVVCLT